VHHKPHQRATFFGVKGSATYQEKTPPAAKSPICRTGPFASAPSPPALREARAIGSRPRPRKRASPESREERRGLQQLDAHVLAQHDLYGFHLLPVDALAAVVHEGAPPRSVGVFTQVIDLGARKGIHVGRAGASLFQQRHAVQAVQLSALLMVLAGPLGATVGQSAGTLEQERAAQEGLPIGVS